MTPNKYENMKITYNRSKLNWYWAPIFITIWLLLFYIVVLSSFHNYPETITIIEESKNQSQFIGERAENMLLRLTNIGPKVVGSAANEQAAIQFLLNEISKIREKTLDNLYDLEEDVQIVSGNYLLWEMVNCYQSIQNVVVKLTPKNSQSNASLLINTHFDTVPGSPGAGDAGIMVVIMLEILRDLATHPNKLMHSIVFLFNGAEENPLQGSHGFITQHKWATAIKAFINLDSAGSGGREVLFQSGPDHPWLLKYYASNIIYPYASTIGEELFQHAFVPSETDYRIFHDYGNLSGLDMAHSGNGYVYHTKYDRFNIMPRLTYQRTGNNILALTKALANAPELENPAEHAEGHYVFYDFLGWIIIYYSEEIGSVINVAVCALFIVTLITYIFNMASQTGMFRKRIILKFLILLFIQLLSVIVSILAILLTGIFLDSVSLSLSWYSKPWMIFGLYFCPMFFIMGILPASYLSYTKERGLPLAYAVQLLMHGHCFLLTLTATVMISFNVKSVFVIVLSIGFYTFSVIINIVTCLHRKNFFWLIPHIFGQILPFLFCTYVCYDFYELFIPVEGLDSAKSNPELLIGCFTAVISLLFVPYLVPLLCLFRKSKMLISIFGTIWFTFMILTATPIGFPFEEKIAPQRFFIVHTTRTIHADDPAMTITQKDAGYYVVPVDRRPTSIDFIFDNANFTMQRHKDCNDSDYIMCGYPIYSSRWFAWMHQSFWVNAIEPNQLGWPELKVRSKNVESKQSIVFNLELSGPDHMSIFIQPLNDTKLVDWSFTREPLEKNFQPPYFIYFSYALDPSPLNFYLDFQHSSADWSGPTFRIAITGHKVHDDIHISHDFREFLALFPNWAHITSWTASYESWIL